MNNSYNNKIEHIYHMNALIRSLNDEEGIISWLVNGVPDDVKTIDELKDTYADDEEFDDQYDELVELFVNIIKSQTKYGTKVLFV